MKRVPRIYFPLIILFVVLATVQINSITAENKRLKARHKEEMVNKIRYMKITNLLLDVTIDCNHLVRAINNTKFGDKTVKDICSLDTNFVKVNDSLVSKIIIDMAKSKKLVEQVH